MNGTHIPFYKQLTFFHILLEITIDAQNVCVCAILCNTITCPVEIWVTTISIKIQNCPSAWGCPSVATATPSCSSSRTLGHHYSALHLYSCLSSVFYKWNLTVCSLWRLAFYTRHHFPEITRAVQCTDSCPYRVWFVPPPTCKWHLNCFKFEFTYLFIHSFIHSFTSVGKCFEVSCLQANTDTFQLQDVLSNLNTVGFSKFVSVLFISCSYGFLKVSL